MKLRILGCGTSTGVPVPACTCPVCTSGKPRNDRLRTSALIEVSPAVNILIDTSPDLRLQALRAKVTHIEAVLFTHAHSDHTAGLDDLRGFCFGRKEKIKCYGTQGTLDDIKKRFAYAFTVDPTYEGGMVPQLSLEVIDEFAAIEVEGFPIQCFALMHGKAPVTGYRFGTIAYATDCNFIPERSKEIIRGVETLVIVGLRHEKHRTHFTINEAVEVGKSLGVKRTVLTHMTHRVDYDEVSSQLPPGVELAYDGMVIDG